MTDAQSVSDFDKIAAIISFPAVAAIAEQLSVHDPREGGRPRKNSVFSLVLAHVVTKTVYEGRVRKAMTNIRDPRQWAWMAETVRATYPDRPDFWLNAEPMNRSQYLYFRDRYIAGPAGHSVYASQLEEHAISLMSEMGLCQPGGPGSFTRPHRSRQLGADGVVIRPASDQRQGEAITDRETGEITGRRRGDSDISEYHEGGKEEPTYGHKLEVLSARGDGWYTRVILAVDSVKGGEMATLKPILGRLLPRLPGVQGVLNDAAMRGEMIEYLAREHGVIGTAPTTASKKGDRHLNTRKEKEAFLQTVSARRFDGGVVDVELWVRGGEVCTIRHNETGERVWFPLTLDRVKRAGRRGAFRFYCDYTTADGAKITLLPLLPTDQDQQRKFNRCENYRVFPPGSDGYSAIYGGRSDTESSNRELKDALWQRRSNVYRRRRVLADTLAWAIGHNAIAAYVHRRSRVEQSAAA